ncbi:hypothetical protein GIB67_011267 [Kingdonia uniflora]|uniref:Alpha/beta hydrolase fold-3 domain-containing protein n=1 Tax=Kingdonia uniflora TaxID=39325 RepID=A0A7J7NA30_9MAGN|nr:hypothetical protein GIB67_011267 [Kingdonia uniflora]
MNSINVADDVEYEILPILRVYKDGRVERLVGTEVIPPSFDPQTNVTSKDVVITPETGVSARLYLPKITDSSRKLPLLIYYHGGRFCVYSPFHPAYHNYLNTLVSKANVVAISIDYRRAPEHRLPTAYNDSWAALQWVGSHCRDGGGPEAWLNDHVNFERVFLGGDSAGGNIVHNLAIKVGRDELHGLNPYGIALVHAYLWGLTPIGSEAVDPVKKANVDYVWPFLCPSSPSNDDPRVNPFAVEAPRLEHLKCKRVLVCVAEKDVLKDRGWLYYETLKKSDWEGVVEIVEAEGEDHVFHLYNQTTEKAHDFMNTFAHFLKN